MCVEAYMATPTGRGGGSVSWQRVPLSRLALPVNCDSAVILYSAVIYLLKFEASVRLCAPWSQKALTLYPATDCAAATDISGVSGRWQLSR